MAKEKRTKGQLVAMVLQEAKATGKCSDLQSIFVIGPIDRGYANWDIGISSDRGTHLAQAPVASN
jgi:hypothetical protein